MLRKDNKVGPPKFNIGEIVKVRSKEEIAKSLDWFNKLDGCLFMDQMWEYCGQRFKILKIVRNFFDEYKYKMYRPRVPLYLLESLICKGEVKSFGKQCDRSCYLLWHEDWLEEN